MIHALLQRIVWTLIKLLISTYKYEYRFKENQDQARRIHPKGSFIFCLWHGQVLSAMAAHAWTQPYLVLASRSKDGDYAAFVAHKLGFVAVRGSSRKKNKDKGGKEAIIEFVNGLQNGTSAGITVDGPKGPAKVCKVGVVVMSQQSGSPILPTVALPSSYWEFNSWDNFKLPKPFTTITVLYGEPIAVAASASPEEVNEVCLQVADSMKKLEADFK